MGTLIRKTSLLRTVPTACGQAADKLTPFATCVTTGARSSAHERDLRHARCSERSYLFTMSDIFQIPARYFAYQTDIAPRPPALRPNGEAQLSFHGRAKSSINQLVEPDGIEPTASCLQSRRSPN